MRSGVIGKTSLCLYCWDLEWCGWKDFTVYCWDEKWYDWEDFTVSVPLG